MAKKAPVPTAPGMLGPPELLTNEKINPEPNAAAMLQKHITQRLFNDV